MNLLIAGLRVTLDVSDLSPSVAQSLSQAWRHCAASFSDDPDIVIRVLSQASDSDGDTDLVVGDGDHDISYRVSQHVTRLIIAHHAGQSLMFHAAGLCLPHSGDVVGVIAPSGTGKTTFCEILAQEFGYVTDETLIIGSSGVVFPYQKPLSIIRRSSATVKEDYSPADLGLLLPASDDLTLKALVLGERTAKQGTEELVPLSLAEAMEVVIGQTSSLFELPNPLDFLARVLVQSGGPWKLRFHDQSRCASLLTSLHSQSEPGVTYCHIPGTLDGSGTLEPRDFGPIGERDYFIRAPWTDAVESEGHVVILVGHQPLILGGAGAAVWLACEQASSLADLHRSVVDRLGSHPGSWRLVEEATGALISQGVLSPVDGTTDDL